MASYLEAFPDTLELFKKVISAADLERFIHIKILVNNKLKEIGKVVKANDLLRHMTNEDVIILINEAVFEQLTDELKLMQAEELIASIHFDTENDKIVISKPDIVTYSGLVRKYSWDEYVVLKETLKSLFSANEQEEDASESVTA